MNATWYLKTIVTVLLNITVHFKTKVYFKVDTSRVVEHNSIILRDNVGPQITTFCTEQFSRKTARAVAQNISMCAKSGQKSENFNDRNVCTTQLIK